MVDAAAGHVIGSVRAAETSGWVALTLDDGPDPDVTPAMLELLDGAGVTATFFLLAERAERYRHLVESIVGAGHEVALHGLDHRRVSGMSRPEARTYLASARDRLEQVAGTGVHLFRPPYGSQSVQSFLGARDAGLDVVVWSADAQDWVDRSAEEVAQAAMTRVAPGGVLLLHERLEPDPRGGSPVTSFDRAEMVGSVIRLLREQSLEACSVRDLSTHGRLNRTVWIRP
jgi:peptidoglycan/xylan/chitin deacetylase (PgdA/CDA1 family)